MIFSIRYEILVATITPTHINIAIKAISIPYFSLKVPVAIADRISVRTAAIIATPTPNLTVKIP